MLFEPWTVETKTGGFYKVYTPMWKSVRDSEVPDALPTPATIPAPDSWPASDDLADWQMGAAMQRGADIAAHPIAPWAKPRPRTGWAPLSPTMSPTYVKNRDLPAVDGTSGLSENLTYGEIGPRSCWHAGWRALHDGKAGAETFLKELVWREFAYHLAYHTPRITTGNWKKTGTPFPGTPMNGWPR